MDNKDGKKFFENSYLELLSQVQQADLSLKMNILGIQEQGSRYVFDFFNRRIIFDGWGFLNEDGTDPTPAVKFVLCKYILMSPDKELKNSGKLMTFREFENAGPLFSMFTANTGKIIQTSFSNRIELLKNQCLNLGGTVLDLPSYDLSVRFMALPKIPVILNFNDKDDIMPATAGFLYEDTVVFYLDLKSLTITCTYLTGLLIQQLNP